MKVLLRALQQGLARLPLTVARGLGAALGGVLYVCARRRRQVAEINLTLCQPQLAAGRRQQVVRRVFVHFAQAWVDRVWLWHGRADVIERRLQIRGDLGVLTDRSRPVIVFAPHFMGLDAGWVALAKRLQRPLVTIYTPQRHAGSDAWIRMGRLGAGPNVRLFTRSDGIRPVLTALAEGSILYLLPDMDFGAQGAVFVPFCGVPAATTTSLARLAKLSNAQVVSVQSRLAPGGYEIDIGLPWPDFPTGEPEADTARMNKELETLIDTCVDEYYWVHKRFKTRPSGQASVYDA